MIRDLVSGLDPCPLGWGCTNNTSSTRVSSEKWGLVALDLMDTIKGDTRTLPLARSQAQYSVLKPVFRLFHESQSSAT